MDYEIEGGIASGMVRVHVGYPTGQRFSVPFIPKLVIERTSENAILPKYSNEGDSGMDVYASEDILLCPQEKTPISLGWKFELPKHPLHELGYRWGMMMRPRSGITVRTEVEAFIGTIDNTYRGEVKVIVKNDAQRLYDVSVDSVGYEVEMSDLAYDLNGLVVERTELNALGVIERYDSLPRGSLLIRKGDRIAQLVFEQVIRPMKIVEGKVSEEGHRGGGFGSTGVRDDA